jgi:hypothetical protein
MGRKDIDVTFRSPETPRPESVMAAHLDTLGGLVDEVVESEVRIAIATARRIQAIERARKYSEALASDPRVGNPTASSIETARRAFVCEIAAALHVPDRSAERLIRTGQALVNDLPNTLLALGEGRLSYRHAQILVDNCYGLEPEVARDLETRMLPVATTRTASQFEQTIRKTRERLEPDSMVERHVRADEERNVELIPENDGMVFIGAHVPAATAIAIDNFVSDVARSLQDKHEPRTFLQLKTDVFTDLLLDVDGHAERTAGHGSETIARIRNIRPTLLITVPAMTMLKRSDEPGIVEGYGPIDPSTAREIASRSKTMRRLITDPVRGIVLTMDRRRYRIPKDLRIWLRVRDGRCRFPGCNRTAARAEIDHTHDFALGGKTDHDNLACLCPKHHALKGTSEWTVEQIGGGRLRWTSPARIPYVTDPETIMEPAATDLPEDEPPF